MTQLPALNRATAATWSRMAPFRSESCQMTARRRRDKTRDTQAKTRDSQDDIRDARVKTRERYFNSRESFFDRNRAR